MYLSKIRELRKQFDENPSAKLESELRLLIQKQHIQSNIDALNSLLSKEPFNKTARHQLEQEQFKLNQL